MKEEIQGQVDRITFTSDDGKFAVVRLLASGYLAPLTVVGPLSDLKPGEEVYLEGEWEAHARFGRQFKVAVCRKTLPASEEGIRKYLASSAIDGIGPAIAARIVERFGTGTLSIIEREPERLLEVPGLGRQRLEQILKAWRAQGELRDLMIFLRGHGLGEAHANKIFKKYGGEARRIIENNPYRLARDIDGLGFRTADQLASSLDVPPDSPFRIRAGLNHVFLEIIENGHVCYPIEELTSRTAETLGVDEARVASELQSGAGAGEFVLDSGLAYPAALYRAETGVLKHLSRLQDASSRLPGGSITADLTRVQNDLGLELAPEQIQALGAALRGTVSLITGGPGTGKTTIIRALLTMLRKRGARVEMAAPTGRAARRLSEASGGEARTIHRLLEFRPGAFSFARQEDNPLEAEAIIVDESSMIDMELMNHLLRAVPDGAHLVLIGDADQLPSVGPGRVFGDLIASGRLTTTRLERIFRQAGDSGIISNAHLINHGLMPDIRFSEELSDFYFISQNEPSQAADVILKLCAERIPQRFGLDPFEDLQVLSPMHRGEVGVARLNELLQERLNPHGPGLTARGHVFRRGDKVMQLRNNYEKEVFNGDMGRVADVDSDRRLLGVRFDHRHLVYDLEELGELTPAYAISIHKSQGSEYPAVVLPLMNQHYVMLRRNLLYTAVTRARKLVVIVGNKQALGMAVKRSGDEIRHSRLVERLTALT